MRNNAAYLPENPIVYIIFPESIHNRASFLIFVTLEFDTDDLSACGIDSFRGVLPHFPVFIYRFFFDIFYLIGIHDL